MKTEVSRYPLAACGDDPPIFEAGQRVRIAGDALRDPAAKVTDFIGLTGTVRYMVADAWGVPAEWVAVSWPGIAGLAGIRIHHADEIEEVTTAL